MGVDYSPNYGIGFRVIDTRPEEDKEEVCFVELLYEEVDFGEDFEWFEIGDGDYTGEDNWYYVCLTDPFKYGLDLTKQKENLEKFLKQNNIKTKGEFGLVGGLLIH